MRVLTAEQMREADRRTIEEVGLASIVLMENAGHQTVQALYAAYGDLGGQRIGVLCGRGNNGGDGFVVARLLWLRGHDVDVFLFGAASEVRGDAAANLAVAQRLGVAVWEVQDADAWREVRPRVEACDLFVDAVFGTGLSKPLDAFLSGVAADVNALEAPLVAVDLPSGLAADRPDPIGEAFEADLTVTLAVPKLALLVPPADAWAGDLVVADIGIPSSVIDEVPGERLELLTPEEIQLLIPPRPYDAHKGDFGHVLVVGGSRGKTGAARLAGDGALRAGAGLVTVATPDSCQSVVASSTPEYMTLPLPETDDGSVASEAAETILRFESDVIAVGPGLGTGAGASGLVQTLVERTTVPLVLDADALNVLADGATPLAGRDDVPIVITPHPGEMARLGGMSVVEVQADRLAVARQFARDRRVFVVLKGAGTVIAAPDGQTWLSLTGNAGMATGGVGDVLTGVVAAWLAQLGRADVACQVAVFLHGLAGDLAAETHGEAGLTASDVAATLGRAAREVVEGTAADDGPEP